MTRELFIAGKRIADDTPAFVVAEIGHNHQGSVETCKELFRAAAACGVDAVKLQKRDNRVLFTDAFYNQPYNSEHAFGPTYGQHREALEFGWEQYVELKAYAESLGLVFFATAFDIPSADFLARLDVPAFKIASACLTDITLIRQVALYGVPVLISTGGGAMIDVERACDAYGRCLAFRRDFLQLAILQCTATYPVQPNEMNLGVIEKYRERFPYTVVGLSDHQDGIDMAPVAYALGARIFEKHFTLSHSWKGSDHAFSLEPEGMRRMVQSLRRVQVALGDGIKRVYESEKPGLYKMGKSLVAARAVPAGYTMTADDIAIKSPGGGLPPYKIDALIGKVTPRFFGKDESLEDVLGT